MNTSEEKDPRALHVASLVRQDCDSPLVEATPSISAFDERDVEAASLEQATDNVIQPNVGPSSSQNNEANEEEQISTTNTANTVLAEARPVDDRARETLIENLRHEIEVRDREAEGIIEVEAVKAEDPPREEAPKGCAKKHKRKVFAVSSLVVVAASLSIALGVSLRDQVETHNNETEAPLQEVDRDQVEPHNETEAPIQKVQCDPHSDDPDAGILSCGTGHICVSDGSSPLGGTCVEKSRCDPAACDCSMFDNSTGIGTFNCSYKICYGPSESVVLCQNVDMYYTSSANGSYILKYSLCSDVTLLELPYKSICRNICYPSTGAYECEIQIDNETCKSCFFDNQGCMNVNCTNIIPKKEASECDEEGLFPAIENWRLDR